MNLLSLTQSLARLLRPAPPSPPQRRRRRIEIPAGTAHVVAFSTDGFLSTPHISVFILKDKKKVGVALTAKEGLLLGKWLLATAKEVESK